MGSRLDLETLIRTKMAVESCGGNFTMAAAQLGIPRTTLLSRYTIALRDLRKNDQPNQEQETPKVPEERTEVKKTDDSIIIEYVGSSIQSEQELIASCNVDLNIWEVAEVTINNWEVGGKINTRSAPEDTSNKVVQKLWKMPLRQIKVKLRKKSDERLALESLISIIGDNSKRVPLIDRPLLAKSGGRKRSLEVCIMDPHYGLQCYKPSSDMHWSLEECEDLCMWAIEDLINKAKHHGPYEEIIFPFGNDYMHHDNMSHETTKGTPQPEGLAWSYVYERAEILAINMVERLKKVANIKVISIPGNHDHHSAYTLARVLNAYYRNDENVTVDADSSPYKFHRYGVNLIGFEHGHHISSTRLPGLMANERPLDWSQTIYREWHLGDQHRKGSGKPSTMEEQGVSVEYLPALTPPNQWHRLKAYNWQKRGAMAFVWDYHTGPEARLQSNIDTYTGRPAKG